MGLAPLVNCAIITTVPKTSPFGSGSPFTTATSESSVPKTNLFGNLAAPKPETTTTTFRTLSQFAKDNRVKLQEVLTHERQLVYEIHDILKAYYKISV